MVVIQQEKLDKMIYSELSDRLGNNLFQFGAAISITENVKIYIDKEEDYLSFLNYKDLFFKGFDVVRNLPKDIPTYNEIDFAYKPIPYTGSPIHLKGYFQSYKYLNRSKVIKQFSLNQTLINSIHTSHPFLKKKDFTSIHVRRGDYLKVQYKHPFSGKNYYEKAIEFVGKDNFFIIVSDDIEWCKNNIKPKNVHYMSDSDPITDFFIQTISKNNIISNSSFSYWAAYINESKNKVIAPSLWFGFRHNYNNSELLPPEYDIINNDYSIKSYTIAFLQFISHHINYKIKNILSK